MADNAKHIEALRRATRWSSTSRSMEAALDAAIAALAQQAGAVACHRALLPIGPGPWQDGLPNPKAIANGWDFEMAYRAPPDDRRELEYLMGQFDAEMHVCGRCGFEESTKDCDSAIHLRGYLASSARAVAWGGHREGAG